MPNLWTACKAVHNNVWFKHALGWYSCTELLPFSIPLQDLGKRHDDAHLHQSNTCLVLLDVCHLHTQRLASAISRLIYISFIGWLDLFDFSYTVLWWVVMSWTRNLYSQLTRPHMYTIPSWLLDKPMTTRKMDKKPSDMTDQLVQMKPTCHDFCIYAYSWRWQAGIIWDYWAKFSIHQFDKQSTNCWTLLSLYLWC